MTIFFTADTHIGHRLMAVTRGFEGDIEKHDTAILSKLSDATKPDDIIYVLGDVAFCSFAKFQSLIEQYLPGRGLILIAGNHDHKRWTRTQLLKVFESVHDYLEIKIPDEECPNGSQMAILCHYPLESWRNNRAGAWHLHGHHHGGPNRLGGRINVSIESLWPKAIVSYQDLKGVTPERYGKRATWSLEKENPYGTKTRGIAGEEEIDGTGRASEQIGEDCGDGPD